MGIPSHTNPPRPRVSLFLAVLCTLLPLIPPALSPVAQAQTQTQATTVPLNLPEGLAYDALGNLYFAETGNHVIRCVSPSGVLTTVAGTGTQGFAGDGGPATAALLDTPTAIALDLFGDLFIADSHNHRIRRVSPSGIISTVAGTGTPGLSPDGLPAASTQLSLPAALALDNAQNLFFADAATNVVRRIQNASTLVTTVAGNGIQGFSGDNGPALQAMLDTPSGLALDTSGNLFLADSHNHRIRRVDRAGLITTVAGTGTPAFSGDAGPATLAALNLPLGLAADLAGNLLLADSANNRIRRIDAHTGLIATVAGNGIQAFAGDLQPAIAASLNTPSAVTLSPATLLTLADTCNNRIRQVDATAIIHTIAGLGTAPATQTLTLTGPTVLAYGSGTLTATLNAGPATGAVTFFDTAASGSTLTLTAVPLIANAAILSTASLSAGSHRISATYPGDATHPPAQSNLLSLSITPASLTASITSFTLLYGQPLPTLTGTLTGVLPQDIGNVALQLSSPALPLSPPATYPIIATLTGSAAPNYTLTAIASTLTIAKAPVSINLTAGLAVHVASSTSGQPTGSVQLLDNATPYASILLSSTGDATFSSASLTPGTHTLTAVYSGDADFLPITSTPILLTVAAPTPPAAPDFTLISSGTSTLTISPGASATFAFTASPLNGTLSSPILLAASGLPTGATASFTPTLLTPSAAPTAFTLTIQTLKTAILHPPATPFTSNPAFMFAALLPLLAFLRSRQTRALLRSHHLTLFAFALLALTLGCGSRINTSVFPSDTTPAARTYNITVNATATSSTGATLLHTATVTLVVQ